MKIIRSGNISIIEFILLLLFVFQCPVSVFSGEDNPLDKMRDFTAGMFKPVSGKVLNVQDNKVKVNLGAGDSIQPGMRFNVLREEAPFRHPVTKQFLGRLETLTGRIEIKEISNDMSTGVLIQGSAKEGDKLRISEIKVNLLFCQTKGIDWSISDSYYKKLGETGRFNMMDTDLETDDPAKLLEEGRRLNADVAILLVKKPGDAGGTIVQKLYYVPDGIMFSEKDIVVPASFAKELKMGEEYFSLNRKEESLRIDLPMDARLLATGDIDGDGREEIVLAAGKDILFYTLGIELKPGLGGLKISGSKGEEIIWIDTADLNKNGRAELIVTSMKSDEIISNVYELNGSDLKVVYKDNIFLRRTQEGLIGQAYSKTEGFTGPVFAVVWDGGYKKSGPLSLPKGVNVYDFVFLDDPRSGRLTVAYDEKGFLNVFDSKAMSLWRSKSANGGFLTTFKKASPSIMVDRGEWSVKDRLGVRNANILAVERQHFVNMVKGLGYKNSRIRSYMWNGMTMEERVMIDKVSGTIFDYAVSGDTLLLIASPAFGVNPGNILKGENPLKTELYIYSLKRI